MKFLRLAIITVFLFGESDLLSQSVVVSEIYGGGGNSGSIYKNDFIELYNPTSSSIDITGWSVQYISAAGTGTWQKTNLSGTIAPRSYYLVQQAAGTGGTTNLPTPDAIGTIVLAATAGKVAIVSNATALSGASPSSVSIIDLVGFGTANFFEGTGAAPAPSNTNSIERKANASSTSASMQTGGSDRLAGNGYDSNENGADFVPRPAEPQNSSNIPEPDVIPPTFSPTFPQSSNVSSSSFDLIANLNEAGTVYFVALPDGSAAPTPAQVKAGHDSYGNPIAPAGSIPISASGSNFFTTVSSLSSGTNYDVYVVAEDLARNLQTTVLLMDVTTNVAPSLTPSISSFTFAGFTEKSKQSASTSYTIAAANLIADVNVSASGDFLISSDDNIFNTSLYIPASDLISPKTVFVKFNPSEDVGTRTGIITHSTSGASDQTVSLTAVSIDPFNQNFNDPMSLTNSGWTQHSITGAQTWSSTNFGHTCLTGCNSTTVDKAVQMNGYSGAPKNNEDWLISPQLDLTAFANYPALSFATISAFEGDVLQLKYSTDYAGSGDPSAATWITVDGKFPSSNSSVWTTSSNVILPKSVLYVGFVYTSNTTSASRWTLDDWKVENVPSYLNTSPIDFLFGEVTTGHSSSSQNFVLSANGYGDLTVSAPTAFEVSLDNTIFSSSVLVPQAEASAGKTIYVRFTPPTKQLKYEGAFNFSGAGLNSFIGSLVGSSYPKAETFNIATYNLEFFGTDVKDANNNEFGPTNDALQIANVLEVLKTISADIFAVEEISDDNAFDQLVSNLPGYSKIVSDRWSYSWQPPDPHYPPQKTGFIYNTSRVQLVSSRVMFAKTYDSIVAGMKTLPSYPTGTSTSFWSSGRLPFMATFDVSIDGAKRRIRVIDIHGKSGSDQQSYDRRVYDVKVLRDSLNNNYPHDNIILIGDFNDQVNGSITLGVPSSYELLVDDVNNFKAITYELNTSGASTFPRSNSFIDNVIVSNELVNAFVINSATVEDPRSYISNYINTTSDHLPVWTRFLLSSKADQTLVFNSPSPKSYGDPNFALSATASSGLDITYASADPSILSINGNVATILRAGSVKVTASQTGNEDFSAAPDADQTITINKANQTISFSLIADKTLGDSHFEATATSSSGLAIEYSTTSDKVTIIDNEIAIIKAGRLSITASQLGNENYNAAVPVGQSFCINPMKPEITIADELSLSPILTSSASSNNQWYFNGNEITDATQTKLLVKTEGAYKVQTHEDDCFSEFSVDATVIITAIEKNTDPKISIYPNPVEDYFTVSGIEAAQLSLMDSAGKTHVLTVEKNKEGYRIDLRGFSMGLYVLGISDEGGTHALKVIKK